jgi:hypothetical protein
MSLCYSYSYYLACWKTSMIENIVLIRFEFPLFRHFEMINGNQQSQCWSCPFAYLNNLGPKFCCWFFLQHSWRTGVCLTSSPQSAWHGWPAWSISALGEDKSEPTKSSTYFNSLPEPLSIEERVRTEFEPGTSDVTGFSSYLLCHSDTANVAERVNVVSPGCPQCVYQDQSWASCKK